jgi:DNA-binding NarL/FixJ family response regulator
VIVLTNDEPDSDSRMAKLAAAHPAVPILVVDVDGTQATAEIIRQGASDMAAKGVSDADLARKVARLARRKR